MTTLQTELKRLRGLPPCDRWLQLIEALGLAIAVLDKCHNKILEPCTCRDCEALAKIEQLICVDLPYGGDKP